MDLVEGQWARAVLVDAMARPEDNGKRFWMASCSWTERRLVWKVFVTVLVGSTTP
jgi:hypothetical protein